ncbi:unnamed protein product [Closterium sp. Yama58-4]|nr:unnamed protein product [Closterium sp. Yama58-4]
MKPILKGTEGEWVLSRYLLPPGLHEISVGDVVVMRYDPAKAASYAKSANPEVSAEATANDGTATAKAGTATGVTSTKGKKAGDVPQLVVTAASFKSNNPKKLMKRKKMAQSEAATSTASRKTDADTSAADASSPSSSSSSASQADTPQNPLKAAFRRVAAVAGDEIVSSRPSDEPFRIEKDHFWLLADNLAVPAKEAIDSRTIGPVHKSYILERALYVVRSEDDHGPIQNSFRARVQDAGVMEVECNNIDDILRRILEASSMAPLLQRFRYLFEKGVVFRGMLIMSHLDKHPGTRPPYLEIAKRVAKLLVTRGNYLSLLKPTATGDESMKPILKGTEGEWVLSRYLIPPGLHDITVGDVVMMLYDPPAPVASNTSSANPEVSADATAKGATANGATANGATANGATANGATADGAPAAQISRAGDASRLLTAASFKRNNPKKAMKRKIKALSEASANAAASGADASSPLSASPSSSSSSSPSSSSSSSPSSSSSSSPSSSSSSSSSAFSSSSTEAEPFHFAFRRVAAVEGDEIVSSQPADEPFRIEKDHFWLLADNPDVPVKEAIDSRTIGPVHRTCIAARALYVVRTANDHGPIQNSYVASMQDEAIMAMECNFKDIIRRIIIEVIRSFRI